MTRSPFGLFAVVILFLTGVPASAAEPENTTPATNAFRKVVLESDRDLDGDGKIEDTLPDIMEIAVAADGRVFYVERAGAVRVWRPESKSSVTLGSLKVYKELEDGLLGIALNPGFTRNGWIYLFYSEPETHRNAEGKKVGTNRVSRFTVTGETLDLASEKVLLRIATQREDCCHSGGSLAFDANGNLFASVGDNTHPGASDGYAPIG